MENAGNSRATPGGLGFETFRLSKRFGAFTALDAVSLTVRAGTVHALLGENGAGKSTLVKCLAGYHRADDGALMVDGREQDIRSPADARALGIGMVYQHFTVVPGMTVAENLLLARGRLPAILPWKRVRAELQAFMDTAPFRLDLEATPQQLSAGEKQKLEILKQLFLRPRLLVLDEPSSVLTPQEAEEVLGALRKRAHTGACTVVLITHKFREVTAFADDVSVLRRGRLVGSLSAAGVAPAVLADMMVSEGTEVAEGVERAERAEGREQGGGRAVAELQASRSSTAPGAVRLAVRGLRVAGDRGDMAVDGLDLEVRAGEIVGVAGVSGNGQREMMQALVGQRERLAGQVQVDGQPFAATRAQNRALRVRSLPEEPLHNACVPGMSVAENMALRRFDEAPFAWAGWRRKAAVRQRARQLVHAFRVRTRSEQSLISSLSGGNVQRAVLARELSDDATLLLVSNPSFGLDFTAVAEVHQRLDQARWRGAAVLMVGEDLDELLQLADRIVVMSHGRIVHSCSAQGSDRLEIGRFMGGGGTASAKGAGPAAAHGLSEPRSESAE
ncbi:MAG: ABC transporter ATP-binding protein [Betaproteobacteria bacterium]